MVDYFLGDKENVYVEEDIEDGNEEGLTDEEADVEII